jgi:soluble lytic murein transglycosylase-like protein
MGSGLRLLAKIAIVFAMASLLLTVGAAYAYASGAPAIGRAIVALSLGTAGMMAFIAASMAFALSRKEAALLFLLAAGVAVSAISAKSAFAAPDLCTQYRSTLIREAQAVYGLNAPIPALIAQLRKESSCRADVTAWDDGRGLAQFMDGTTAQVGRMFPELGPPDPYDPRWAIRALVRYDNWLYERVKGDTYCERWAAALKGYNAGLGYVQRAQRTSPTPGTWFNGTENINAGQSAKNFEDSRRYPRVILFKHQPLYAHWGVVTCPGTEP